MKNKILIVDDQYDIRQLLSGILSDEGYHPITVESGEKAIEAIDAQNPHVVLLDVWLANPRFDGVYFLDLIKKKNANLPVIMISGHGTIETAVNSLKKGAYDFIEKPFKTEVLLSAINRAVEYANLKRELNQIWSQRDKPDDLIGISSKIGALRQAVDRVSKTNGRVLIEGETGAGKESLACLIHEKSARKRNPFCVLSCVELTPEDFDKKVFGDMGTPGLFELAAEGTVYLDSVHALTMPCQQKLLKALREGEVAPRIISSTTIDMKSLVEKGVFLEDLFFRLNVVNLKIPSLKERCEDIPQILDYFIKSKSQAAGLKPKILLPDVMIVLQSYDWPGNVRQLKNFVEWLLMTYPDEKEVTANMLPTEFKFDQKASVSEVFDKEWILSLELKEAREKFEKVYLTLHMKRFNGNISKTSKSVGMDRTALHRKIRQLGIAFASLTEPLE